MEEKKKKQAHARIQKTNTQKNKHTQKKNHAHIIARLSIPKAPIPSRGILAIQHHQVACGLDEQAVLGMEHESVQRCPEIGRGGTRAKKEVVIHVHKVREQVWDVDQVGFDRERIKGREVVLCCGG